MKNDIDFLTKPIIKTIEEMVEDIPGWSPIDQLYTLFNLVFLTSHLEGDIVELGSWCGRSASVLGLAADIVGNTNVHCVDLFPEKGDWYRNSDDTYSFCVKIGGKEFGAYQEQTVWKEPYVRDIKPLYDKHNGIFNIFNEKIKFCGLSHVVKSYKGDLEMFINQTPMDFKCRLAFIDGDHSYDAVCSDIKNIERYLVPGGYLCFDDAFSSYDGVNKAILDCIIKNDNYAIKQQMTRKFFVAKKKG